MSNVAARLVLKNNPIFGTLPNEVLDSLAEMATSRGYQNGEVVFNEGEPGNLLLGLISGRIRIQASSNDGRALNLNMIMPGEIIGEIAFLDGGLRTASGLAEGSIRVFSIAQRPFFKLLRDQPELAIHLMQLVCQRVRWTSLQLADFAFLTPPARLATQLLHLRDNKGDAALESADIHISQAELARFLGVSRQVVNGYLRDWQAKGALLLKRGRIHVTDEPTLRAAAGLPPLTSEVPQPEREL